MLNKNHDVCHLENGLERGQCQGEGQDGRCPSEVMLAGSGCGIEGDQRTEIHTGDEADGSCSRTRCVGE